MTDLSQSDAVAAFIRLLTRLDSSKSDYDKFRDFCEMGYCAVAKLTAAPERAEALEERYMQIVGTYRDKDAVRAYPELLAIAAQAVSQGGCDFLGDVATKGEMLNARLGQFFTPYHISRLLAEISLQEAGTAIEANGFITIQEPASGAGGMVLAAADVLEKNGFDPGLHMLVNAIDVSPLCFHMTFLQLALRDIPAFVEQGNTLTCERVSGAWTPAAVRFYRHHGRLFPEGTENGDAELPEKTGEQLVLL